MRLVKVTVGIYVLLKDSAVDGNISTLQPVKISIANG